MAKSSGTPIRFLFTLSDGPPNALAALDPVKFQAAWFTKVEEDIKAPILVSFSQEWPVPQETFEEILFN